MEGKATLGMLRTFWKSEIIAEQLYHFMMAERHPPTFPLLFKSGQHVLGRLTIKVAPFPGVLLAVILPPCRSTIFLQMASPIPIPS